MNVVRQSNFLYGVQRRVWNKLQQVLIIVMQFKNAFLFVHSCKAGLNKKIPELFKRMLSIA